MVDEGAPKTTLSVSLSAEMVAAIARFQAQENLATQADAARLLLEIAIDAVTSAGNRFWDKTPDQAADE